MGRLDRSGMLPFGHALHVWASGAVFHGQCSHGSMGNCIATPQDFVTALPDLQAVMLQAYISANTSSLTCCAMAGEDFIYPATEGVRPEKSWVEKQIGAYMADLLEMASGDATVFSALMPVRSLQPAC